MTGLYLSHYAIEAELGRGGMGIVYRGKDTKLNRTVALKVLPASALASPDDRARFQREAQAAAAITQVSNNGGIRPAWSSDGRTLFYAGFDNRLKASDFDPRTGEVSGGRELPSPTGFIATAGFAVHPDGRFLLIVARDENLTGNDGERFIVRFVINVFTRLQERAP